MEEKTVILVLNKKLVVRRMTLWAKRNIADQEYSKQSTIMMIKNVKGGTDMADQKLIDEVGKYILHIEQLLKRMKVKYKKESQNTN